MAAWLNKLRQGGGIFELARFVLVGGMATLTDLTVTLVLFYLSPGIHENVVTTCAFGVAFFVSYFGHRYVTFRQSGSMTRFFLLSGSMLLLRNLLVYLMVTFWMRGLVPIIVAMVLVTAITYLVSKYKVFAAPKPTSGAGR
ncbi:MAG: GtrA family protein [Candidatus Anaerobiospirillum merdipullorum]|uniref:GtrA family protein n=1 Tax=Candidatus Anaerobiospirillum merdipullorum TaxID=2838450 RepID=A0A9E2NSB3_9GAMM|nr:GtrA family protein [Candidatus Anaerobiospirillum merdipullorum]